MCLENYTELILKPSTKCSESYVEPEKLPEVKLLAGIKGWCCLESVILKWVGREADKACMTKLEQLGHER